VPLRGRSLVQLVALGLLVAGAVTAAALLIPWLPTSASKERDRIDFVFWFTTGIAIFIFSLVVSVILYSVVRFRARPDDDTDGPPIHGHTGLEIAWTAVPTALVTAIAIISAIVLHDNSQAGNDPLQVNVVAQQFTWQFEYANGDAKGVKQPVLRLPIDRPTRLEITSKDVVHSFWVPEFGQKQDAVPGQVNPLVITPNKLGTFPVICTELCGLGHPLMRSQAIVLNARAFEAWARASRGGAAG
jgi:cytochrome c oxidase subunit 2